MSNDTLKKEFWDVFNHACEKIGEPGWCYVNEISMDNYSTNQNSDFETASEVLNEIDGASEYWSEFMSTGDLDCLYELYIIPSVAVAIAIKVFICPDVEILLGCETSKYSESEVDYWWAISSSAPKGIELTTDLQYDSYLSHMEKGEEFLIQDGDFKIVDGVLESYKGKEKDVVIPDSVKKIGYGAFEYADITSVIIPDSVKKIEDCAFSNCEELVSVKLPKKIKTICDQTFANCTKLISIEVPDGITKIGESSFEFCSSLQSIRLPDSVVEIKSDAFRGCTALTTITVPANLKKLGKHVFGSWSSLCSSLLNVIPSESVKTFKNSSVELVWKALNKEDYDEAYIIKDNISLFWLKNYYDLVKDESDITKRIQVRRNIILENCISTDDDIALNGFLSVIKLKIDEIDNLIEISKNQNNTKLTALLSEYMSSNFSKNESSNYEEKKRKIATDKSNRSLADWKKIFNYETVDDGLIITEYRGEESTVEIPAFMGKKRVVAITNDTFSAFTYSRTVQKVIFPNDEIAFSREAFSAFEVSIIDSSDSKENKKDDWIIKTLKDGTVKLVYYCRDDAEKVQIPESIDGKSVSILGKRLFADHKELRFVDIPANITEIEMECFHGCWNLEKVNLSNGLKIIGMLAFSCHVSKPLDIPASVEKIAGGALRYVDTVIVRGNPSLVKNLDIFRPNATVYANEDTDVYKYCQTDKSALYGIKEHMTILPLSKLPENYNQN